MILLLSVSTTMQKSENALHGQQRMNSKRVYYYDPTSRCRRDRPTTLPLFLPSPRGRGYCDDLLSSPGVGTQNFSPLSHGISQLVKWECFFRRGVQFCLSVPTLINCWKIVFGKRIVHSKPPSPNSRAKHYTTTTVAGTVVPLECCELLQKAYFWKSVLCVWLYETMSNFTTTRLLSSFASKGLSIFVI